MNISQLIEELTHYMKDGGDREVLLEIDGERWGPNFKCTPINVIGAPTGLFRNGLNLHRLFPCDLIDVSCCLA